MTGTSHKDAVSAKKQLPPRSHAPKKVDASKDTVLTYDHDDPAPQTNNSRRGETSSSPRAMINDQGFSSELSTLNALRVFVIKTVKNIGPREAKLIEFGSLESLRAGDLSRVGGRAPTSKEWSKVGHLMFTLLNMLPIQQRRRFFVENSIVSTRMLTIYSLRVGFVALASLLLGLIPLSQVRLSVGPALARWLESAADHPLWAAPSWRMPAAVFLRRGVFLMAVSPFRGFSRPAMSQ